MNDRGSSAYHGLDAGSGPHSYMRSQWRLAEARQIAPPTFWDLV